jgi:lambda family phage portal protein
MLVKIFGFEFGRKAKKAPSASSMLPPDYKSKAASAYGGYSPSFNSIFDGDKFPGGFGLTELQTLDYWTLRQRSSQLFYDNLYAYGLINRLVTNEINTGLTPEACPKEKIIGVPEDSLNDWTDEVETRFDLWAKNSRVCDYTEASTFGALQRKARMEALIAGDVLVVLRRSRKTMLPTVQLIAGDRVRSPFLSNIKLAKGHEVRHGVELDDRGREVAYWVTQKDNSFKRLPAYGEKTGRRLSWLLYGAPKRLDDVRGLPILSLVLQSLREIDRYRDSTQRKAVINSTIAGFVKKTEDKPGTLPITGSAVRRDTITTTEDGEPREFKITEQLPGAFFEELQTGEEPVLLGGQGTDTSFGPFEETIISAVAWAHEIPPEILKLAFSNNYSASQAAINEFKIYLNKVWTQMGEEFCTPIYVEWLLNETLLRKIESPGLLEAWRDPSQYDIFGAWISVDWYGSIKPSTDMLKQAKGSQLLIKEGWSTNAREARITTGTKFADNIRRLKRENEEKAKAMRPLLELEKEFGGLEESSSESATVLSLVDSLGEEDHG